MKWCKPPYAMLCSGNAHFHTLFVCFFSCSENSTVIIIFFVINDSCILGRIFHCVLYFLLNNFCTKNTNKIVCMPQYFLHGSSAKFLNTVSLPMMLS